MAARSAAIETESIRRIMEVDMALNPYLLCILVQSQRLTEWPPVALLTACRSKYRFGRQSDELVQTRLIAVTGALRAK